MIDRFTLVLGEGGVPCALDLSCMKGTMIPRTYVCARDLLSLEITPSRCEDDYPAREHHLEAI